MRRLVLRLAERRHFHCGVPCTSEAGKYVRKSAVDHVLLRPDTYIGGVGIRENQIVWTFDEKQHRFSPRTVNYAGGLLKIFDEILVNAADNKMRDSVGTTMIRVDIDRKENRITVFNNGKGLPVKMHPEEGLYVPSLVFGHLFTSSNYDDDEVKIVGGRNGYGAKLCNIFSKEFTVETVDSEEGKRFRQTWYDNMKRFDEPEISDCQGASDYTMVSFKADLEKFSLTELSSDVYDLMVRRVHDIAATLPNGVTVVLNGDKIPICSFEDYVRLYLKEEEEEDIGELCIHHPNARWNVILARRHHDSSLPSSVSFVNNIHTLKGGSHVDYIVDKLGAIIRKLAERKGENDMLKSSLIKANVCIFINSFIENPSFESQTKESLLTKPKKFGSSFEFDSKRVELWLETSGLMQDLLDQVKNRKTRKRTQKLQKTALGDLIKLEDAEWASNSDSQKRMECSLLLTEGDSAKALALAGLEVIGRQKYGVFPLRGKLVNVSHLTPEKAVQNAEVSALVRILGLKFGQTYSEESDLSTLRYGKIMILADQDEDGSHIKGLVINFIHTYWPNLLKHNFICSFRTPLLKVKKDKNVYSFFTKSEFLDWKKLQGVNVEKLNVKYYKGLGTSTSKEAREYFSDLNKHLISFSYNKTSDDVSIRNAFDRDKAARRREWMKENGLEDSSEVQNPTYAEFIDGDLVKFGLVDLKRSIPCIMDGLKPSQRKVLYTLLQSTTPDSEIKVSQLAAAVAQSQAYHHGEEALVKTIVRLAQSFCGTGNIRLLEPFGQFGTRHEGGHDAASARYIFTALSQEAKLLFPKEDLQLLQRAEEDGRLVEPLWLCPIIPTALVNGVEGIGTGWSTKIANRSTKDVIDCLKRVIECHVNDTVVPDDVTSGILIPSFNDFEGKVDLLSKNRFGVHGKIRLKPLLRRNSPTFVLEITELPVNMWTSKYKEKLVAMENAGSILGFTEHHTEKKVRFEVCMKRENLTKCKKPNSEVLNMFKLSTSITEKLVLFDPDYNLKEYPSIQHIMMDFFVERRKKYEERRERHLIDAKRKAEYAQNQVTFIEAILDGSLVIQNRSKKEIVDILAERNFAKMSKTYDYLLEMPLHRLTKEEMQKLFERAEKRRQEHDMASKRFWYDTWIEELEKFEKFVEK